MSGLKWSVQYPLVSGERGDSIDRETDPKTNVVLGESPSISQDSLFDDQRDSPTTSLKIPPIKIQPPIQRKSEVDTSSNYLLQNLNTSLNTHGPSKWTAIPKETVNLPPSQDISRSSDLIGHNSLPISNDPHIDPITPSQFNQNPLSRIDLGPIIKLRPPSYPSKSNINLALYQPGGDFLHHLYQNNEVQILPPLDLSTRRYLISKTSNVKQRPKVSAGRRSWASDAQKFLRLAGVDRQDPQSMGIYTTPRLNIENRRFSKDLEDVGWLSGSTIDNTPSEGRHMSHLSHPSADIYSSVGSYPFVVSHKRFGLEKSLTVPILVGVAAALISFLIISNLFLSIPLFAMTLFQMFNGNMGFLPNNNNSNGNGNSNNIPNNQNGQTTNGRKKREISTMDYLTEKQILNAIDSIW